MIRLIYAGKSLADEQNIAHYNMKAGDTIHMLLQLKGGKNWIITDEIAWTKIASWALEYRQPLVMFKSMQWDSITPHTILVTS